MPRLASVLAAALVAAPSAAAAGAAPGDPVGPALQRLAAGSYRATFTTSSRLSFRGLPASLRDRVPAGVSLRVTGEQEIESPTRRSAVLSSPEVLPQFRVVAYDGAVLLSRDGSVWRTAAGPLARTVRALAPQDPEAGALAPLGRVLGIRASGEVTIDGLTATRYDVRLDPAGVRASVARGLAAATLPADARRALARALRVTQGEATVWIASDTGQVDRIVLRTAVRVDVRRLLGDREPDARGTMVVVTRASVHPYDVGAPISVALPPSAGPVSSLNDLP